MSRPLAGFRRLARRLARWFSGPPAPLRVVGDPVMRLRPTDGEINGERLLEVHVAVHRDRRAAIRALECPEVRSITTPAGFSVVHQVVVSHPDLGERVLREHRDALGWTTTDGVSVADLLLFWRPDLGSELVRSAAVAASRLPDGRTLGEVAAAASADAAVVLLADNELGRLRARGGTTLADVARMYAGRFTNAKTMLKPAEDGDSSIGAGPRLP